MLRPPRLHVRLLHQRVRHLPYKERMTSSQRPPLLPSSSRHAVGCACSVQRRAGEYTGEARPPPRGTRAAESKQLVGLSGVNGRCEWEV